jgi:hypothetical protein
LITNFQRNLLHRRLLYKNHKLALAPPQLEISSEESDSELLSSVSFDLVPLFDRFKIPTNKSNEIIKNP